MPDNQPLVTVICTVYNHEKFVNAALASVIEQTYPRIELIVIDNASKDSSLKFVWQFAALNPEIVVIENLKNLGLCAAFNQGLARAKGEFIIDLSADDVLLPGRVQRQVEGFLSLPAKYAVLFSNARFISADGNFLGHHFQVDPLGKVCGVVPQGDVFLEILRKYFICTPTMMMRKSVLDALGGYDERLFFEDFDFWVRSSRSHWYYYQDEILTEKRILPESLGAAIALKQSGLLASTLAVCLKAYVLCRTPEEFGALASRIRTFIRKCFYAGDYGLGFRFLKLLEKIEPADRASKMWVFLAQFPLPVNFLYRNYLSLRRGILRR